MVGRNAQNITLARFAQRGFYFSRAVTLSAAAKEKATLAAIARAIILRAICGSSQNSHHPAHAPPSCVRDRPSTPAADKATGR